MTSATPPGVPPGSVGPGAPLSATAATVALTALEPAPAWLLRSYVWATAVLALLAVLLAAREWGLPHDLSTLAVFVVVGILAWLIREQDIGRGVHLSFTSIVLVAAAAMTGPVGAAVVGAASTAVQPERARPAVRLFNISMAALLGAAGGGGYRLVGGVPDTALLGPHRGSWLLMEVGLPLIVADIGICVLNAVLVGVALRLSRGDGVLTLVTGMLRATGPVYLGYGILAFLWVLLWGPGQVGWVSTLLILMPLLVAQWAMEQYGEQHRARSRTLEMFVTVLDARHHEGRAHSVRVGRLSGWTAEALGLPAGQVEDVGHAGLLHDLGRVAEPAELFSDQELVTPRDAEVLRRHPEVATQILDGIGFVAGSLPGIRHHHERVDGRGYPDGLAGDQIPLAARIVAAADCFEHLTSPHGARLAPRAALRRLEARGGDHLDARVVAALAEAVSRHGWPSPESTEELPVMRSHDDPSVVDAMARMRSGS